MRVCELCALKQKGPNFLLLLPNSAIYSVATISFRQRELLSDFVMVKCVKYMQKKKKKWFHFALNFFASNH